MQTIQSISLLAYLAEKYNIWGPFLVVAPASTLHNWDAELTRFVPKLKAKPYWGQVKDRATMRKYWSKKDLTYDEDTDHHIIVTSYQMVSWVLVVARLSVLTIEPDSARSAVLPAREVAVHDPRRGAGD